MHYSQILQFIISGIVVGSIYALTALGFTIIYNSTNIINFAQGEFVMLGGVIAVYLYSEIGLPLTIACLLSIILVALVGSLFERLAIYPQRDASIITLIIITIGGSMLFKGVAMHVFGQDPLALPAFTTNKPYSLGGAVIQPQAIWVIIATLVAFISLWIFYNSTLSGKAMKACADNKLAARLVGIDTSKVSLYSFALAAALGALGGTVLTPISMTSFDVGGLIGLKGFAAAILGGLGNPLGALLGGLLLGVLESLSIGIISSGYKDAVSLFILLIVLFFKPSGLLGSSDKGKV